MKTKNALAVIPARGGSKRLPKKNIKELNGKPLVSYTLEAALESKCFKQVILNSDDANVLALAKDYPGVEVENRPSRLAQDTTKVLELMCEIADRKEVQEDFDVLTLLLPTCPFRRGFHIQKGFSYLTQEVDSVVSVTTYDFPPQLSVYLDERTSIVSPVFYPSPLIEGNTRSQDQKTIYRPNGGFYMSWIDIFVENRNYFKGKVIGYPMERLYSVDLDTLADFEYAEYLLRSRKINFTGTV